MKAPEILERLAFKYSTCSSYQDSGTIAFQEYAPHYDIFPIEQIEFKTFFSRPCNFRYESSHGQLTGSRSERSWFIHSSASTTTSRTFGKTTPHPDLPAALKASVTYPFPTGPEIISPLLLPELQENWRGSNLIPDHSPHLLQMTDLLLVGIESLDGHECFVINASWTRRNEITLWICAADYSLRRIFQQLSTAQESADHEQVLNEHEDRMARLLDRPTLPQKERPHQDFYNDYRYTAASFDAPIPDSIFDNDNK